MAESSRLKGNKGEELACRYLTAQGIRILDRNVKSYRSGELDIVGSDAAGTLIFFEVKLRRSMKSGRAAEAVTHSKIKSICRASDYYRASHGINTQTAVRFDVVEIYPGEADEVVWIKNAFDYVGLCY